MKNIVILCSIALFAGCARQEQDAQEYLSVSDYVQKYYAHERYENGKLRWAFLEVLGPEGPYRPGNSGPMQSNPGKTATFRIANGADQLEEQYVPEGEEHFFLGVPVVNREGLNAMIVLKTVEEEGADGALGDVD